MRLLIAFSVLLFLFSGCTGRNNTEDIESEVYPEICAQELAQAAKNRALRERASRIAAAMDNGQLAAQVIITGIDGRGRLTPAMRNLLAEYPAGGIMLFRYNLDTGNEEIRLLLSQTSALIGEGSTVEFACDETESLYIITVYPFTAVDHEGGTVNRFRRGVANLPAAGS